MKTASVLSICAIALSSPLAAASAAPPQDIGKAQPAMPATDPGSWITSDDVPAIALGQALKGTVGFVLTIGPDGRVTKCQVRRSSRNHALDAHTCKLMTERARFVPALNYDGNPTVGTWSTTIVW